jgi:hypothetical protein
VLRHRGSGDAERATDLTNCGWPFGKPPQDLATP